MPELLSPHTTHSIFCWFFWSDCEPPLCELFACELGVVLCCTKSRLFKPELIIAFAVPFDVIDDGVADDPLFALVVTLLFDRPLRPDDNCVNSSTFGVSTDDKCELIGSRQALVAGCATANAIVRGKPNSRAPKSDGPHGLKNPDGADGEWHTTPLP